MVAKIEARNPESVGFLFLRGVEARDRKGDPNQAKSYLEQALWRDQLRARPRTSLTNPRHREGVDRQYELLRRASPYHQIVLWGPSLMARPMSQSALKRRLVSKAPSIHSVVKQARA